MSSPNEDSSDNDDGLYEDLEALRRACQLEGDDGCIASDGALSDGESDSDGDDDLQLVQSIHQRFFAPMDNEEQPLIMKPLSTLMPDWFDSDDMDEDYATLRAIQRRFAAYMDGKVNFEDTLHIPEQVGATIINSEKETSNSFVERTNAQEGFLNCVDSSAPTERLDECDHASGSSDVVELYGRDAENVVRLPTKISLFLKSALIIFDAIKKNRSCQGVLMSKKNQMEAREEELCELIKRVGILKDMLVDCKDITFLQKKRVQLISLPKRRGNMKLIKKNIPASYKGPPENVHVPKYKEALTTFGVLIKKEQWSNEERKKLADGIKQQFKEMLFQRYSESIREADGSYDSSDFDNTMKSIKDLDIPPKRMRLFLPKVNWEKLDVSRRNGAECRARFLNYEDPLINHGPWTASEDKSMLRIIQEKGLSDWIDISASLGTNRTAFQCLSRYQRSLNASILRREWTSEDDQLRAAVETYGESNWQVVASAMEGRTGTQCSNRWLKTLHPTRVRSGKWTVEEDKRLKVAATLYGPKSWTKVASFVPGRTHVQCRERWVNCLDPSLSKGEWTEEEDLKLEEAISKHGYCWSKVAGCIPHRTDNQCWRRWKVLFPTEVQLLQTARKIQKTALISNFVDRESERPALGANDFQFPVACITGSENAELAGNNGIQSAKKASKQQPRRQNNRTLKDVHDSPSKVPRQAATKSRAKKNKKQKTNDAMCLIDATTAAEAGFGTTSKKKRKNSERNTSPNLSGSDIAPNQYLICNTDDSDDLSLSEPSRADAARPPPVLVYSRRKSKMISQVNMRSGDAAATDLDQPEKMVVVGGGSRIDEEARRDQACEDDCTLAHFLSKLKKRRTEEHKMQHLH